MKKIIILLITAVMLANAGCTAPVDAKGITVELDGSVISFDTEPQMIDGRIMVPLRKIFEEIGALVKWDDELQTVSARKSSKTVTVAINSADMQIDRGKTDGAGNPIVETIALDVPAQLVGGRTLVPIRAVSEAFGLSVEWDENSSRVLISSSSAEDDSRNKNAGEINLDDMTFTGDGIAVSGNKITITSGGDFTISGTAEGSITVNTGERVRLHLNNASITSAEEPCIFFENADKAFIYADAGTVNTLVSSGCEEAAVYSKENLEIKGGGEIFIKSDAGHGIKASDNLTIEDGAINIDAVRDGININDTFKMTGGNLNIRAVCDGIDSDSIVIIEGGTLDITTTAEPISGADTADANISADLQRRGFMGNNAEVRFESSSKGINAEWMLVISGGSITVNSAGHAVHCADEAEINGGSLRLSSAYGKGISGHGDVTINEGTVIDILKSTEGIESKKILTINGGDISVIASDDALNGTGGNSGGFKNGGTPPENGGRQFAPPEGSDEAMPERRKGFRPQGGVPPENMGEAGQDTAFRKSDMGGKNVGFSGNFQKETVIINGGSFKLKAGADIIDANGSIAINGGTINAALPNGGIISFDGVLDADGSITIGECASLITATRSGGIPTLADTQNAILIYTNTEHSAGDKISAMDENGNVIAEYTPNGSFKTVFILSPSLEKGKTYTVTVGGESYEATAASEVSAVGEEQRAAGGFGRGFGGRENGQRQQGTAKI